MDATELLLRDHARTHSLAVGQPEGGISIIDAVVGGLDDDQIRRSPQAGMNSLAWLIWHMARSEDAGVNLLVAGRPQVLDAEGWLDRLRVSVHDIAAGMTDDEVSDFSTSVDIGDLVAYRAAVGRRTCEVVAAMRPTALDEKIDGSLIERAFADGTFSEKPGGSGALWRASQRRSCWATWPRVTTSCTSVRRGRYAACSGCVCQSRGGGY